MSHCHLDQQANSNQAPFLDKEESNYYVSLPDKEESNGKPAFTLPNPISRRYSVSSKAFQV